VVGDKKHFLTALIVPNFEIPEINLAHPTELKHLIQIEIDRFQSSLSNYEKVKKFTILDVPFQQENGMLTPTLKLKRNFIIKHYENTIKLMYNEIG
jgi:long-chain acyl-CoA synthetase